MLLKALLQLLLLLAVLSAYIVAARRHRLLRRPLIIALAVTVIGVAVSVLGELYRGGWAGVPGMAERSFIGSAWWGVLVGAATWLAGRLARRG